MKNGHVYLSEDQHYYSVPYELIGKKLKMQYGGLHGLSAYVNLV